MISNHRGEWMAALLEDQYVVDLLVLIKWALQILQTLGI